MTGQESAPEWWGQHSVFSLRHWTVPRGIYSWLQLLPLVPWSAAASYDPASCSCPRASSSRPMGVLFSPMLSSFFSNLFFRLRSRVAAWIKTTGETTGWEGSYIYVAVWSSCESHTVKCKLLGYGGVGEIIFLYTKTELILAIFTTMVSQRWRKLVLEENGQWYSETGHWHREQGHQGTKRRHWYQVVGHWERRVKNQNTTQTVQWDTKTGQQSGNLDRH